jgi:hypothetical protein
MVKRLVVLMVSMVKRLVVLVVKLVGAGFLCLLVLLGYGFWYDKQQSTADDRIQVGATKDAVLRLAGSPAYITDGTRWVEPAYEKPESARVPGCVLEYWYKPRVAVFPSRWSYCFDAHDHLVDKYHWVLW